MSKVKMITDKWLEKHNACEEAVNWVKKQNTREENVLMKRAMKINRCNWVNWFLVRRLPAHHRIMYAIYAAKQVIELFEKEYPDDNSPRNAIKAAEAYIRNPCKRTRDAAYTAAAVAASAAASAAYAADDAAYAAAYPAASAASDAASAAYAAAAYPAYTAAAVAASDAAYAAADAAASAAAYAADAAASGAHGVAENASAGARLEMQRKMIEYGVKLMMTKKH